MVVGPASGFGQCRCGSDSCAPPTHSTCSDPSCVSETTGKPRYSVKSKVWLHDCAHSDAHKTIYMFGSWVGMGCRRGLAKAGFGSLFLLTLTDYTDYIWLLIVRVGSTVYTVWICLICLDMFGLSWCSEGSKWFWNRPLQARAAALAELASSAADDVAVPTETPDAPAETSLADPSLMIPNDPNETILYKITSFTLIILITLDIDIYIDTTFILYHPCILMRRCKVVRFPNFHRNSAGFQDFFQTCTP